MVASMLGRRVEKDFGGGELYGGAVVHVSREAASSKALFTIAYDDGDEEDVYLSELRRILVATASTPRVRAATPPPLEPARPQTIQPQTPTRRPNPVAAHIVVPGSAGCMQLSSANKPLQVYCHLCGREYGTRSLGIHLKTCLERWPTRQRAYAKKLRRSQRRSGAMTDIDPATSAPPPPETELFPLPKFGVSAPADFLAYNAEALRIFGVSLGHATTFSEQLRYLEAIAREQRAETPPPLPASASAEASQTPAEWVLDTEAVRKELRETNIRSAEAFTALAQMQRDADAQEAARDRQRDELADATSQRERDAAQRVLDAARVAAADSEVEAMRTRFATVDATLHCQQSERDAAEHALREAQRALAAEQRAGSEMRDALHAELGAAHGTEREMAQQARELEALEAAATARAARVGAEVDDAVASAAAAADAAGEFYYFYLLLPFHFMRIQLTKFDFSSP